MLTLAKLNKDDLLPQTQILNFSSNFEQNGKYKFFEFDKHLLENLNEGEILQVRGEDDENVILCSKSRTYEVLNAETSNSLLLVKDLVFSNHLTKEDEENISIVSVERIFYDYLTVVSSKPFLGKLSKLLENTIYRGPEHEFEINKDHLLTYEDLQSKIQASEEELQKALIDLHVVTIDNYVRLLDFEYHFRVLSYMLKIIEENSWNLDEIDYDITIESLNEIVPTVVLDCLFNLYTKESKVLDSVQLYRYKETEVCKFFAQVLLHSAGKFNLTEFLQAWKESVPEGMTTAEEMLHGIAVIDRKSTPNVVWAFAEDKLPDNIIERFRVLFEVKEKWTVSEISPYIQ